MNNAILHFEKWLKSGKLFYRRRRDISVIEDDTFVYEIWSYLSPDRIAFIQFDLYAEDVLMFANFKVFSIPNFKTSLDFDLLTVSLSAHPDNLKKLFSILDLWHRYELHVTDIEIATDQLIGGTASLDF